MIINIIGEITERSTEGEITKHSTVGEITKRSTESYPFNYRDFLLFDKTCAKSSAAEMLYEGKG